MTDGHKKSPQLHEREDDFQQAVIELAQALGWTCHHQRPARTLKGWITAVLGTPGFPDLVLAKPLRSVIYAELKMKGQRLRDDQRHWLDVLASSTGTRVFIWYPSDWDAIEAILRI